MAFATRALSSLGCATLAVPSQGALNSQCAGQCSRPLPSCQLGGPANKAGLHLSSCSQATYCGASSRFAGDVAAFGPAPTPVSRSSAGRSVVTMGAKAAIQFIRGVNETVVPEVRLTKSRDGSTGTATFTFEQPSVFESASEVGEITGLFLVDEEGVLQSVDVSAKFLNGKPANIEAKYTMRSPRDWDRFMRFMERYAEENDLGFNKK